MTDVSYALQVAMAAALLGDTGVTDLLGQNVFDPLSAQDKTYPRVDIGEDQSVPAHTSCMALCETYSTLHIWADGPDGRLKAKAIAAEVARALTQTLTLDGHVMTGARLDNAHHLTATDPTRPDPLIAHSVLTFHYWTQATA